MLAKYEGDNLTLNGLTSIDKDVARELAKTKGGLTFGGLTSIDKGVAQELAKKSKGLLSLYRLRSVEEDVLKLLESSGNIMLP